jgi:hypothetical protein
MNAQPRFIQGRFTFEGKGLSHPVPLDPSALYAVPVDKRAKLLYVRAGNASSELVTIALTHDGAAVRLFPIGANAGMHVSLAIAEDVFSESQLEVLICAPEGCNGTLVLDLGLLVTS